ncbi:uncharacterized protein LOC111469260 [Cucurbita maxima]|uniref:Uncharacterized protein LOC111469260 n=1 Tax=Cucurbita maxima TaxID=3661 RepID=A0A6J1I4Z9_CUCMA|nr:uncharacterized protein LOC111469260 [Cucurbita maxima]
MQNKVTVIPIHNREMRKLLYRKNTARIMQKLRRSLKCKQQQAMEKRAEHTHTKKRKKEEVHFEKFMDIRKKIHINIPLVEALKQMPNYVKFWNDVLPNRRKFQEFKVVSLDEECSAILKNNIPLEEKDSRYTIPVSIRGKELGRALYDLEASINLMPLSIYKKLGIREARPTTVTLQLVDRSIIHFEGKIEDILIQVDKFIFPVDFIILDYEVDHDVPIILGRQFLKIGRTLVDVYKGSIT